jgi:phosphatidylglycerol:prolipoprotein diacylglycerol transferase
MLVISLVYCACIYWLYSRAKKRSQTHDVNLVLDLCLIIMVSGFIGARATHIFYENFGHYKTNWLDIFKLWQGGFVFYGGFLTALIASISYLRYKKQNFYLWADFFTPVLALGYAFGRLGCFFAGCCYGRVCTGSSCDWPWMMHFQTAPLSESLRHPTQLYATAWELCVLGILLFVEPKINRKPVGLLFLLWLVMHGLGRIVMEAFRDDPRGPLLFGYSLGTALSFILILVAGLLAIHRGYCTIQNRKNSAL